MTGRLESKVAFITGAARGQGRSHALRLAEEGADVIGVDICAPIETVTYEPATPADLEETADLVRALGRRMVARMADVRDLGALTAAIEEGVGTLGGLDIVVANAGITGEKGPSAEISELGWQTIVDIDLTGVWHTVKAAVPALIDTGRGGSVVLTSSTAGAKALGNVSPYVAAKHGVIGLMRTLALELAPHAIRVNAVLPSTVSTPMVMNDAIFKLFCPDLDSPGLEDALPRFRALNALDVPWVEPIDVSNAILWLASDEARYVTGVALPVDAGTLAK